MHPVQPPPPPSACAPGGFPFILSFQAQAFTNGFDKYKLFAFEEIEGLELSNANNSQCKTRFERVFIANFSIKIV